MGKQLKHSNKKADISVAFVTDNGYAMPTIVAITSLQINRNTDYTYDVYVILDNVDATYVEQFKKLAGAGLRIIIIDALNLVMRIYRQHRACGATHAAQLKFMLPSLIPNCNKLLYLDSDILINKGLEELYHIDVYGVYAAVVRDTGILYSTRPFPNADNYFNSGMLLLNLKLLRKDNMQEKLQEAKARHLDTRWMDQGIFNLVFRDKVKQIDLKYNYLYLNLHRAQHKFSMNKLNSLFKSNYKDIDDIKSKAVIVHFASQDKPWKYSDSVCSEEWFEYYNKSIIAETPLKRAEFVSTPEKVDTPKLLKRIFSITNEKNRRILYLMGFKITLKTLVDDKKIKKYADIVKAVSTKNVLNLGKNIEIDTMLARCKIKYDNTIMPSKKYDCVFLNTGIHDFDASLLTEDFTIFVNSNDAYRLSNMLDNIPHYFIPYFGLAVVCADIHSSRIIEIAGLKI